jgi:hypothetical protein
MTQSREAITMLCIEQSSHAPKRGGPDVSISRLLVLITFDVVDVKTTRDCSIEAGIRAKTPLTKDMNRPEGAILTPSAGPASGDERLTFAG